MIWSVGEDLQLVRGVRTESRRHHLFGTPENVGPVVKGDVLLCKLEGLPDMSIRIV